MPHMNDCLGAVNGIFLDFQPLTPGLGWKKCSHNVLHVGSEIISCTGIKGNM